MQQQLAAVGIDLNIQSLDWGTFYGDIKHGKFELYSLSWVGLQLPDIFRYAFHSESLPPTGANRGYYQNVEVDRLIESAESSNNLAERVMIYAAIQHRLLYDLPYVPLWFEDQLVVRQKNISGYSTSPDGRFDALSATHRRTQHEAR